MKFIFTFLLILLNFMVNGSIRNDEQIRAISSTIYKVFLNEFQHHKNCSLLSQSNSIRILNANKLLKVNYINEENKVLLKVLIPAKRSKAMTISKLVRLKRNENLVKIELFLVNKYNLPLNIRLCNIINKRRRCKTLAKSNKKFLIRLNLTNYRLNSYLVIKMSSSTALINEELFNKRFNYFLIANLNDRLKCGNELKLKLNKRSIEDDAQCRRIIQRVNFDNIFGSKNLIIQPTNYIAYKCEGTCDFRSSKFATNHSTIQSLYNWLKPNSIEQPCCVPVKYKPMYLLNYDINNEIVMKQHENMIVDTCGCV